MLKEKILRLSPAFALAFLVAASGVSSQALAWTKSNSLKHVYWILDDVDDDGIGDAEIEKDENGNYYMTVYDEDGNLEFTVALGSNPKPDGGDSGEIDVDALLDKAQNIKGGGLAKENHFLETTLGQTLIKDSKTGSIVPFHNPDPDSFLPADGGGYGGGTGGGFDPNNGMSIVDQLKKGKKKGNGDDDDDGSGKPDKEPAYKFSADPALVNPVPINLPVAKPGKVKVRYAPAPALIKKGKKRLRNTARFYPTIPNRPSPAMTNNSASRRNGVLRKRRRAAPGNFRTMQGHGGMRRKARTRSFRLRHSTRIKVNTRRNRLR